MADLPKGISNKDVVKKIGRARDRWNLWRSIHQEAYDYSMPDRETFRFRSPGQRKNRHVFDSTATLGVGQFSSRIQGGLVPPWSQWMNYGAGSSVDKSEKDEVDKLLKQATDIFFNHIDQSNFSTEISPSLKDLAVGTGAIMVEELPLTEDKVVKFTNIPLAELYVGDTNDEAWRKQEIEVGMVKQTWPGSDLTATLEQMVSKDPSSKITVWNGMIKDKSGMYHQIVFYEEEKHVIFTQSFKKKRLIVFRWDLTPGEVYGRGPIIAMLPDIRTVNKAEEFILQNAALQVSGVYTGVSDGIFNPHTVRIAPGTVIPVASNGNQNPSLAPLPISGNIQLGELLLEQRRENIRKALFSDPLGEVTDPVRSATENLIRQQEMLRTSGAQTGRLKIELVEPVVSAVTEILQERGLLPVFAVNGEEVSVVSTSPLSQAEALEDFNNTTVWLNTLSTSLPPEVIAASVKIEDLPKVFQEQLGVNPDLVRSAEERDAIGEQVKQQIEQGGEGGVQ